MIRNLYSLGLLRNGKVYQTKQLAIQGLTQAATNDGVAKLARYLYQPTDGEAIIRTIVGFFANADEMEDAGGGKSNYTILDIEGSSADVQELRQEIAAINNIIGDGIDGKTLTQAINEANAAIEAEEAAREAADEELDGKIDQEIADRIEALEALENALVEALTISLETAETPTSGYLKTYILSQGVGTGKTEIGKIDIPKDMVVSGGSLVHGTWDGNTFTEDPDGPDTAIKIEFANADTIYINTKDLVDFYTAGNAAIDIDNTHNTIALKLDRDGEAFLTISEDGLKLDGVQTAIDTKVEEVAARERLEGSDGVSIASNKVKAVAAQYSAPAIKNPISVDKDGIKFANTLDCGFFDDDTVVASSAAEINAIANPSDADVFINGDDALEALTTKKTFKNVEVNDVTADEQIYLAATDSIVVDGMEITGDKGSTNGYVLYDAPEISVSNVSIANGSTAYNVFEGDQNNPINELNAQYVTVDNPSLAHNVFNVYNPSENAVINISDSVFNLTVDNSNVLRLSNNSNVTGVTVNFENIEWTYENGLTSNDWRWAGLIIYQPWKAADAGLAGDLSVMQTWKFNFINCKYNGVKVTANNFGEHNQVFYLYNVGNDRSIKDAAAEGLTLNFE